MTRGESAHGAFQMPNLLRFGLVFRAYQFPAALYPASSLPTLFTYLSIPHSPPPFPKEVNKKLSYRGQNALSVIKYRQRTYTVFIRTPSGV